ncbi:MAG: acyltransferase family protein, partial [Pseudomonadota bacterium]
MRDHHIKATSANMSSASLLATERNTALDAIKGLLIFLVVFGHLIETNHHALTEGIYHFIYIFHMPCFIFISGMLAKADTAHILSRIKYCALVYVLFNALYCAFGYYIVKEEIWLLTPYWIMWFLFSLACWNGLLFIFKYSPYLLIPAVFLGLGSGMIDNMNHELSFQRTFYFLPFFLAGFYISHYKSVFIKLSHSETIKMVLYGLSICLVTLTTCFHRFSLGTLYGSISYKMNDLDDASGMFERLLLMGNSVAMIYILFYLYGRYRITWLQRYGRASLGIYLLHGFLIWIVRDSLPSDPILAIILSILIGAVCTHAISYVP